MTTVLHVIRILSVGGAARVLIAIARESTRLGHFQHRVISLLPGDPEALALAKAAGLTVIQKPNRATILRDLAAADIVHVNSWNNPELQSLLHSELPPMRQLLCLGRCFFEVGDLESAQLVFEQVLKFKPDHPLARENLTVVQQRRTALPERGQPMVLHDRAIPLTDPNPRLTPIHVSRRRNCPAAPAVR